MQAASKPGSGEEFHCVAEAAFIFVDFVRDLLLLLGEKSGEMAVRQAEIMTALYDYAGADQAQGLPLAAGCIVVVLERLDTGWCRGEFNNRQGWFPTTYAQPAQVGHENSTQSGRNLEAVASFQIAALRNSDLLYRISK